jgi:hypothetical protein
MSDRITLRQFVNRHKVTISSEWADRNPNMADETWEANHFKVTLRHAGRQLTTYFSQGYGISGEPTAECVLNSLGMDAAGYENAGSVESWASEYGYDTDSRKAERTYRLIGQQAKKLFNLLGEDLYSTLLWETESL